MQPDLSLPATVQPIDISDYHFKVHFTIRGAFYMDGWMDDLYLNTIRILKLQACGVVYK